MNITRSVSALSPEAAAGAYQGIERKCTLKEEQPYHREAAYLFAAGWDTREVADAMKVTTHTVRLWLREPWFQERVTQLQAERGQDITALFAAEAFATLGVMLEMRDDKKTPATVKAGICRDILDRAMGKPTQYVKTETMKPGGDDPVAEAERLTIAARKYLTGGNN